MTFLPRPYLLVNHIQHYAWGERGPSAYIARLLDLQGVEKDKPFAELWMGAHPLGPSTLEYEGQPISLSELVERYPVEVLGKRVAAWFADQFPFLLKVLSAAEPLSIQLHPSREQAALLHRNDPAHYPDANHKPEIAIALESLHTLAGLKDSADIKNLLNGSPVLRSFVSFETFSGQPTHLLPKLAFLALMRNSVEKPDDLAHVIDLFARQIKKKNRPLYQEQLFLELIDKYPGDVGLLSIFFLKLHTLEKGQAIFIPAGVPHAYLKGNIVECMASSDNVIRAGLTPKFKDIPALLDVTNDQAPIIYSADGPAYTYSPAVREFRVSRHELSAGQTLDDRNDGVRLLLVLHGSLRLAWQSDTLVAERGQSVLLPGSLSEVGIECLEASELYTVDVP